VFLRVGEHTHCCLRLPQLVVDVDQRLYGGLGAAAELKLLVVKGLVWGGGYGRGVRGGIGGVCVWGVYVVLFMGAVNQAWRVAGSSRADWWGGVGGIGGGVGQI